LGYQERGWQEVGRNDGESERSAGTSEGWMGGGREVDTVSQKCKKFSRRGSPRRKNFPVILGDEDSGRTE
jgi:hypothetical protein